MCSVIVVTNSPIFVNFLVEQTLSKVVAAVVKFTPEQARKIQEREEQRSSLVNTFFFNLTISLDSVSVNFNPLFSSPYLSSVSIFSSFL